MAMVREYFNMVGRWTDIFVLSEEGRDWVDWVCWLDVKRVLSILKTSESLLCFTGKCEIFVKEQAPQI